MRRGTSKLGGNIMRIGSDATLELAFLNSTEYRADDSSLYCGLRLANGVDNDWAELSQNQRRLALDLRETIGKYFTDNKA